MLKRYFLRTGGSINTQSIFRINLLLSFLLSFINQQIFSSISNVSGMLIVASASPMNKERPNSCLHRTHLQSPGRSRKLLHSVTNNKIMEAQGTMKLHWRDTLQRSAASGKDF